MPVPGYWDDFLDDDFKRADFFSRPTFSNSRPVDFPMGQNPPDMTVKSLLGTGYYRTYFEAPDHWHNGNVSLYVGGVFWQAWIWLNGHLVNYHAGFSTPYELSLNDYLKSGRNELVIAVDNAINTGEGGFGSARQSGGIYRSVYLKIAGNPAIADVYLYSVDSNKHIRWNVELQGQSTRDNLQLNWSIRDPGNSMLLASGKEKATGNSLGWTTETFQMIPWSDHNPKLYSVEVTLGNYSDSEGKEASFPARDKLHVIKLQILPRNRRQE